VVFGNSLNVGRDKQDFTLDAKQELTFINSGNRPAVISEVYGTLVLAMGNRNEQSQCEGGLSLAKNILLNASPLIIKPGEIQMMNAKVDISYPWKLDGYQVRYHAEDASEAAAKHIVCVEIYAVTPDSASFRWIQALYVLPGPNEKEDEQKQLFGKDEPLRVVQGLHWGIR
jgi:hypothetical protein